jgi:NADH:ubiquinone oxidoreductase subunit 3 (subunit A)
MATPGFFVLGFLAGAAILVAAFAGAALLLRVAPRRTSPLAVKPYECGEEGEGPVWVRFHPRYYVIALCFLVFDVEVAFLFPWALANRGLGWPGIAAVAAFVGVLLLGWWYALRTKALRWQ